MRAERCLRTWPASPPALMVAAVLVLGLTLGGSAATARDDGPVAGSVGDPGGGATGGPGAGSSRPSNSSDSGGGESDRGSAGGGSSGSGGAGGGSGGADPPVPTVGRAWPVGSRPSVARGWEPPATAYGRGHRGVDLTAAPGAPVRTVATGRVSFAGRVAGRGVVSVELSGTGNPPLRTTYEPVRATVKKGAEVTAGEAVGVLEPAGSHCPASCLHWGLRRGDTYLDPLSLLPPWLLHRGPSRLLPVTGAPEPADALTVHQPLGRAPGPARGAGPTGRSRTAGRGPRRTPPASAPSRRHGGARSPTARARRRTLHPGGRPSGHRQPGSAPKALSPVRRAAPSRRPPR
ncbi:peptidoglycan DD-metalloendopeptidase family protein [Streptomyces sp. NPDC002701]|uniref:peptidoglycan DD-metalloendopeptidase family protein n=1 Tax=Streptomyces sp. NPDC002701 TaxID=3364661 RepID=UPI00369B50E0